MKMSSLLPWVSSHDFIKGNNTSEWGPFNVLLKLRHHKCYCLQSTSIQNDIYCVHFNKSTLLVYNTGSFREIVQQIGHIQYTTSTMDTGKLHNRPGSTRSPGERIVPAGFWTKGRPGRIANLRGSLQRYRQNWRWHHNRIHWQGENSSQKHCRLVYQLSTVWFPHD